MPGLTVKQTLPHARVPVVGFVAFSGTGKTTLLMQLIPLLRQRGLRIAAIKHSHHKFDIDKPGKDSYELRKAGIDQMLVASHKRWALMVENDQSVSAATEPNLDQLIAQLDQSSIDLILVEGFKHENFTKIELHRPELGHERLYPNDRNIIAFGSTDDGTTRQAGREIPFLNMNNPAEFVEFLFSQFQFKKDSS